METSKWCIIRDPYRCEKQCFKESTINACSNYSHVTCSPSKTDTSSNETTRATPGDLAALTAVESTQEISTC